MNKRKTIYDVAQAAGVSTATVSRVMTGKGYVSEATRKKVLDVCGDYYPIAPAKEMRSNKSMTIGIIINHKPDYFFLNTTYLNALCAITTVLKEHGYRSLLDIGEDEDILDLYYERKVDGLLLMGVKASSQLVEKMVINRIPFVLIGRFKSEEYQISQVDIDDQWAAEKAVKYLIQLGHCRIGIITGSTEYASCRDRLEGYKAALKKAGIPIIPEYIKVCDNLTDIKAEHLAKELLFMPERVTAVIGFNDRVALSVYKAAKEIGLRIPEQLSVIGFDDSEIAKYATPPLTTIWQPSYEKGEKAVKLLLSALESGMMPKELIILDCIMMYRESCAAFKEDKSDT